MKVKRDIWREYLRAKQDQSPDVPVWKQKFSKVKGSVQREIRTLKNEWWSQKTETIQAAAVRHDSKAVYKHLRFLNDDRDYQIKTVSVKDKDGRLLATEQESLNRWKEHFEELFTQKSDLKLDIIDQVVEQPTQDWLGVMPSLEETKRALRLPCGKTCGKDGILGEMLLPSGLTEQVHQLFQLIWETKDPVLDWRDALVIPVPKKGDTTICDNNRSIFLLSIPGKAFARLILQRIQTYIESILPESQCGFSALAADVST